MDKEIDFVNLRLQIEEVNSSLAILQYAVQNESDFPSNKTIDNYLEILIERVNNILSSYDELTKTFEQK